MFKQIHLVGELLPDRRIDEICLKFVNIGNRKIIIDNIAFLLKNNDAGFIFPHLIPQFSSNRLVRQPFIFVTHN